MVLEGAWQKSWIGYKNFLSCSCTHLAHSCGKGRRREMGLKITLRVVEDCGVGVVKGREPWSLCDLLSSPLLLCLSNQLFPNGRTTYLYLMIIRNVIKPSDNSLCPQPQEISASSKEDWDKEKGSD